MKYYLDTPTSTVYAYESDGSQDAIIPVAFTLLTDAQLATLRAPTFQAIVSQFDTAVEAYLHAGATAAGYTNIERACMYAPAPNPYEAESQSFVAWAGAVWKYCYGELQKVQAGTRSMPTVGQIISELPARIIP